MLERRDCDPGGPRRSHRLPIAWRGGDSRTSSGRRSARVSIPTIASSRPGPGRKSSASWNSTSWRPRPFVNRSAEPRPTRIVPPRIMMGNTLRTSKPTFANFEIVAVSTIRDPSLTTHRRVIDFQKRRWGSPATAIAHGNREPLLMTPTEQEHPWGVDRPDDQAPPEA